MSGGKTVNKIGIKKALAMCLVIFKPKGLDFCPRNGVHAGMTHQYMPLPQSESLNGGKGGRMIRHPFFLPDSAPADFFPLSECEDGAG